MLKVSGFTEGLFLVRQSTTAKGDFVLSVVHQVNACTLTFRGDGLDVEGLEESNRPMFSLAWTFVTANTCTCVHHRRR